MLQLRPAAERGSANYGWLNTHHSFSFGRYYDPEHMGFRSLRVMNEDWVQPGTGFGMHGHSEMEILTYVLEGELAHQDSMGNGSTIRAGQWQRMSAGTGIRHSEANPSDTDWTHLYQIWLLPNQPEVTPSYEEKTFFNDKERDGFRLIASPDGREDSLTIHQDAYLYLAQITPGKELTYSISSGRGIWAQVLRGKAELAGKELQEGDGIAIEEQSSLRLQAKEDAEVLIFDLA
ncbi:Nuclease PIN [Planctomycetales bacterium 10988]|nr:Nuclease PIN [Planctomycetales bacterium 10988]